MSSGERAGLGGKRGMRRGLLIFTVFMMMAASCHDAKAGVLLFGTRDKVHHLQDLSIRGPNGESLYLGYVSTTHSFMLPYKMTGDYVLVVRGAGGIPRGGVRDVFHRLPNEKIEQMQRVGALPKPLPTYRHTMIDYLIGHILWGVPLVFLVIMVVQSITTNGRDPDTRFETRSA